MLRIQGSPVRLCDGLGRRDFLRLGALGGCGLSLPTLLQASQPGNRRAPDAMFGRAKRCIMLFMWGGPPQQDTWDLKPNAPAEIRGELSPIDTNVPGIQISELFPLLARQADKYCILRSVTHDDRVHTTSAHTMLTGTFHAAPNTQDTNPTDRDHPHLGAMVAKARPASSGLPAFVAMPETIHTTGGIVAPGQGGGFLGKQFGPYQVNADVPNQTFHLPDIQLPEGMTAQRLGERRSILDQLNRQFARAESNAGLSMMDSYYQRAFGMLSSSAARNAFELEREPASSREAYGSHLFGQGVLLARRLLEAGVSLVTVYWHYEGPTDSPAWDTHRNNYGHLRQRLMPHADRAFSQLLTDLSQRGMLDDTLVVWMGEFGRTPRLNPGGGRDHWPFVQSVVLAGGGVRGGSVYGSSDRIAGYPADLPVSPPDLTATLLTLLGVPLDLEFQDPLNRPIRACAGTPIRGLMG